MTMEYIRNYYQVPACVGGRVEYTGGKTPRIGTITGSSGPHLLVKLDGEEIATPFHPTWKLRILSERADA